MLDSIIQKFWDGFAALIPHQGLQFLSFVVLIVLIFLLSKHREKRWYLPLWLALCVLLFIPFISGLKNAI